jgi:hypothetical protein
MEQINDIELRNEMVYPDDAVLERVLGPSFPAYRRLVALFDSHGLTHDWRFYRDGNAWLCKVQQKTRTIAWMSAWPLFMQTTFYFPEKHAEGVFGLPIREETKAMFRNAKKVGKSTPCTFDIRDESCFGDVEAIIAYKITCR